MTTIYIVTDGDYSDYHVVGVYSTEETAERARAIYNASGVEEYELDDLPDAPPGMVRWRVRMDRDGNTDFVDRISGGCANDDALDWSPGWLSGREPIPCVKYEMWAVDEAHAVKIANERRTRLIADGQWTTDWAEWRKLEASAKAARAVGP